MKKRILLCVKTILVLALLLSASLLIVHKNYAKADSNRLFISGIEVNRDSKKELYNLDNKVSATYYNTTSGGYVVCDTNNDVVEYSKDFKGYIDNTSSKQYYLGPFQYYQKNNQQFVHMVTKNTLEYNDLYNTQLCYENISSLEDNMDGNNGNNLGGDIVVTCGAEPSSRNKTVATGWDPFVFGDEVEERILTKEIALSKVTPALDTNHPTVGSGNCGSTASAIVCLYHYNNGELGFANNSWAKHSYINKNDGWQAFTDYFIELIEPEHKGSTLTMLVNGINTHMENQKLTARYKSHKLASLGEIIGYNTVQNTVEKSIKKNYPPIIGLSNEPKYNNHWVVGEGVHTYDELGKSKVYYVVNDGWGNNGVEIAKKYIDCTVYRSKE